MVQNVLGNRRELIGSLIAAWSSTSTPSLRISVEITEYLRSTRRQYPHQPLMSEDYSIKLISSGYLLTRKRRRDGTPLPTDSLVFPATAGGVAAVGSATALPGWWIPPQLNHLTRSCGTVLNGEVLTDDTDETFQLGVRAEGANWKSTVGKSVSTSVLLRLDRLTDRCGSALDVLPNGDPNGRLTSVLFSSVWIPLDSKGNGTSSPIRLTDPRRYIETGGAPPMVVNPVLQQVSQRPIDR